MRTTFKPSRIRGWLVVALLVAIVSLLTSTVAQAITGGSPVPASQRPYVAEIIIADTWYSSSDCTGTLIGPRWVITAAHCVLDSNGNMRPPSAFKVSVGNEPSNWAKTAITVNRVERHPNYPAHLTVAQPLPADFALLQLSHAVTNTPLALAASEPATGASVTFAGWGCTGSSTVDCHKNSAQLNIATSTVRPDSDCGFYGAYVPFDICTARAGPTTTIRHGDSGGPMIKRTPLGDRLAGVISGLWTNYDATGSVPYVLGWIHQVTGIGAPAESNPAPSSGPTSSPPPASGSTVYYHQVYHTCANGACGLRFHTGPGYSSYAVTRVLLDGTTIGIVCQTRGQAVSGADGSSSNVWDRTVQGDYAADFYVNTPGMTGAFSPPIPEC